MRREKPQVSESRVIWGNMGDRDSLLLERCSCLQLDSSRSLEYRDYRLDSVLHSLRSTTPPIPYPRAKHTHTHAYRTRRSTSSPKSTGRMVLPFQELTQFKTREEQDQEIRVSERPVVGRTLTRGEFTAGFRASMSFV
jgi:hypothetical protein